VFLVIDRKFGNEIIFWFLVHNFASTDQDIIRIQSPNEIFKLISANIQETLHLGYYATDVVGENSHINVARLWKKIASLNAPKIIQFGVQEVA
jgi:hypothetical protein